MESLKETISFFQQLKLSILLQLLIALITHNSFLAQSNGKISGVVVDQGLGDPLIGVNVLIDKTMLGAATDIEGKFTIPAVAPGEYKLIVSMIGYTKQLDDGVILIKLRTSK